MKQILHQLKRFRDEEDGNMAIELMLVTPILVWVLLSTFVYFDLYRTEANAHRVALTMADMFSREQTPIVPKYLDGADTLLNVLTFNDDNPDFRVTVMKYEAPPIDKYSVVWSEDRGLGIELVDEDLADLRLAGRLPMLSNNDRYILVETRTEYEAPFDVGLSAFEATDISNQTFDTFILIRPRFNVQLCWDPTPETVADTKVC